MKKFNALKVSAVAVALFALNTYATDAVQPDNSKVNQRDASVTEVTAQDQGTSDVDMSLTQRIRKEVTDRGNLSVDAQNIKIITIDGKVTLKGPVQSATEKRQLEQIAKRIAGAKKVTSLIEVKTR
jgi:hyperosmotically inducible protein